MPTYDYECNACGHEFELFQSIKAAPVRKCPSCGKLKARRLIGIGAGVIFKGSGFYCTDYRDKSYNAAAKNDKPPTPAGGDKGASADKDAGADKTPPAADKSGGEKSASSSDKPAKKKN